MKRSWIGFALLVIMLLGSILVTWQMTKIHEPIGKNLTMAAEAALDLDWDSAEAFFLQAETAWKKWEHFRACAADHNPVEEIDASMEMLKIFRDSRDVISFAAGCRELTRKVLAVGEAHELVWWNLL